MARCKYIGCRDVIERWGAEGAMPGLADMAPADAEWLAAVWPDGPNGERAAGDPFHCPGGGSNGRHEPLRSVTVERHPGDVNGDWPWCLAGDNLPHIEPHGAGYLVNGVYDMCGEHLHMAVDRVLFE
jgi:hypothetical protein